MGARTGRGKMERGDASLGSARDRRFFCDSIWIPAIFLVESTNPVKNGAIGRSLWMRTLRIAILREGSSSE